VFYLITTRLILSPVRALKETAAMVREGDTSIRADIRTGDEFEELGETFNQMLEAVTASQQQLRAINASLDLKVNELAERNVALFESNKLKGDFLANVSHELRTPLNSIIGFAELLQEQVEKEAREIGAEGKATEPPALAKRKRYLDNIVMAGRGLLEMINSLLDMAKLEAGRMELKVEAVNLPDLCEALIALIRPLADRGGVELTMEVAKDLPLIETDAKKLQQVVFNLLSNAVKFTSEMVSAGGGGAPTKVSLRAERLFGRASEGAGAEDRVRISVLDTGPGISAEDQEKIFQKFEQLDSGHTRRHAGTGLGLAICKELTNLLQGEIQVDSEVGRGSMFSVILPIRVDAQRAHEMKLEMAFRGSLSSPGASALPPGAVPRPTGRDAVTERA
jgi:signal transduction histidine kinase